MKKHILIAASVTMFLMACSKVDKPVANEGLSTSAGKAYGLSIRNNMLHFENAELYDKLVSMEESEVISILKPYEKMKEFTSLAETNTAKKKPNDEGYMPNVMLSLLNERQLITIESKVFRINNETGKVYAAPADAINAEILNDLANEQVQNKQIEIRSVDEDLFELLDKSISKAGPLSGCPTWANHTTYRKGDDYFTGTSYLAGKGCNGDVTPQGHRLNSFIRYYRGGILFELIMEGWETTIATGANSCTSLSLDVPGYRFKRNNANHSTDPSTTTRTGSGSIYWKPYSGANRLCWYYLAGNLRRNVAPSQESGLRIIYFNFVP